MQSWTSKATSTMMIMRRALLLGRARSSAGAPTATTAALSRETFSTTTSSSSFSQSDLQVQQHERLRDESILAHIVCPISKFPLRYDAERGALICDEIHVAYPIRYGVPMLVPSEARIISHEHENENENDAAPTLTS